MLKQHPQIEKLFNVAAVKRRFKRLNLTPVRQEWRDADGGHACLLGSFEHFLHSKGRNGRSGADRLAIANYAHVPVRLIHALEAGWEQWPLQMAVDRTEACFGVDREGPVVDELLVATYELGVALGNELVGPAVFIKSPPQLNGDGELGRFTRIELPRSPGREPTCDENVWTAGA